jgi:hypothetical protein
MPSRTVSSLSSLTSFDGSLDVLAVIELHLLDDVDVRLRLLEPSFMTANIAAT